MQPVWRYRTAASSHHYSFASAAATKIKKIHKEALAAKDKKIAEVEQGGRYLADTMRAEILRLEAENQRIDSDRRIAFASVAKLRKTPQYEQVVKELARLQRFSDEESARFKDESEAAAYKIANLEHRSPSSKPI